MIVELPEDQVPRLRQMGLERHRAARRRGAKDLCPKASNDRLFMDINGIGGEAAVAQALGLPLQSLHFEHGSADLTLHGIAIDVKTTHHEDGVLLVQDTGSSQAHVYVLVVGEMPRYRIAGWATSVDVFQEDNRSDKFFKAHALPQRILRPWSVLRKAIEIVAGKYPIEVQ